MNVQPPLVLSPGSTHFNGVSLPDAPFEELLDESTKTPEPPVDEGSMLQGTLQLAPKESSLLKMTSAPQTHAHNRPTSTEESSFSKMRSMLAQQMGVSQPVENVDGSDAHSSKKGHKSAPAPAPPRRDVQTALSANRHSYSSSTSSLSSNQSERVAGSHDVRSSVEVQKQISNQLESPSHNYQHTGNPSPFVPTHW